MVPAFGFSNELLKKIGELKELIGAYRSGTIKERGN